MRAIRAATTNDFFSRTWHRSNIAAADALGSSGTFPVDALHAFRASHRTPSSLWRAADAISRFGE